MHIPLFALHVDWLDLHEAAQSNPTGRKLVLVMLVVYSKRSISTGVPEAARLCGKKSELTAAGITI